LPLNDICVTVGVAGEPLNTAVVTADADCAPVTLPRLKVERSATDTFMFWPALAPICSVVLIEPSNSFLPLKVVVDTIRSISDLSCCTSSSRYLRSCALLTPFDDCTASSRIRWSMLETSSIAPSAVCAMEIPSLALRIAAFKPRTWDSMRELMARPAASSLAELMREPVDKRSMAVVNFLLFAAKAL